MYVDFVFLIDGARDFADRWKREPLIPIKVLEDFEEIAVIDFGIDQEINSPKDSLNSSEYIYSREERPVMGAMERFSRTSRMSRERIGKFSALTANVTRAEKKVYSEMVSDHAKLIAKLSADNAFMVGMVKRGELAVEDKLISQELIGLKPQQAVGKLVQTLSKVRGGARGASKLHKAMANSLVSEILKGDKKFTAVSDYIREDIGLHDQVLELVAGAIKDLGIVETENSLSDVNIVNSREWAFFRKEHVDIQLQTPKLRGPVSVNAVSPESELFIQQSKSVSTQSLIGNSQNLSSVSSSSVILSNQVKSNLGTLFDFGSNLGTSMSEQGFSRDTNRSEKRSIVESTLSEVSQNNAMQTLSGSSTNSTQVREYRTEGKDDKYATTEVAFEVFSPVKITHYLDAIGTVWCPRILNPYRELITLINEYEEMIRREYISENKIVNPSAPIPSYESYTDHVYETTKKTSIDDDEVFEESVVVELTAGEVRDGYIFDNKVTCRFKQDDTCTTDALSVSQYKVFPATIEVVSGKKVLVHTKYKIIDENTINPDSVWLEFTLTTYRYSQVYLEQLKDYEQTVNFVNPARTDAIAVQAKKYARLKREELIKKYEISISDLKDFNFTSLMKDMFMNNSGNKGWSYYHGVIKSCIDWNKATYEIEPGTANALLELGKSPYHFLNADAIRFFLPVHTHSEEAFFEAVGNSVDSDWREMFDEVKDYIDQQRSLVEKMRERMSPDDIKQLTLDEYDSEIVLGRHLESVLSNHPFSAS